MASTTGFIWSKRRAWASSPSISGTSIFQPSPPGVQIAVIRSVMASIVNWKAQHDGNRSKFIPMGIFEFNLTGRIEVDADALGVAVANSIRTQPNGSGEIDIDAGFQFRENPAFALEVLLRQGVFRVMEEKFPGGWQADALDATAAQIEP